MSQRQLKLRHYIIANMLDGDESGIITIDAKLLVDTIEEIVAFALMDSLGLHDWAESYYNPGMPEPSKVFD